MRSWERLILVLLGFCFMASEGLPVRADDTEPAAADTDLHQQRLMQRYERMIHFNLEGDRTIPAPEIDSLMTTFQHLELGERIAAWADYFWRRGDAVYRFGLTDDGYTKAGRLVDDFATDCVLFFYRTTELGRSSTALEAVQFAYGTRFHGASLEEVVADDGRVDYDNPVHRDFSIDIIRSGIWGADVTTRLGVYSLDEAGSDRYEPGTIRYLPTRKIDMRALRSGDIVFFVTDETTGYGKKLRDTGAIIGHIGIVRMEDGEAQLIHPASKPLPGVYDEGGKIVKVPLKTYLERVESFKGIIVTRIENF